MDLRTQQVIQDVVESTPSKTIPELQAEFQAWVNGRLVDVHDHVVSDLKRELISRYVARRPPEKEMPGGRYFPPEYVFQKFLLPREFFSFPEHMPIPPSVNSPKNYQYEGFRCPR